MRYKIAEDAKPQVWLLVLATAVTVLLWFLPFAEYLVYPIRLFVTFVHESSHALMSVLTGGSVQSLTIAPDGSGQVYSYNDYLSGLLVASAGYLGTTAFGVLMLFLIRRAFSPNKILIALSIFVMAVTGIFTVVSPIFNFLSLQTNVSSIAFTAVAGLLLAAGLFALGRFLNLKYANFAVAFLAVQCLLNAIFDLKNLFFINAPIIGSDIRTDAANIANATGIPGIFWVVIWIGISLLMISFGLRLYAVGKNRAAVKDTVFED
ncbi:MAG: M50 family metallopeptidase [Pyrinomonadaceae bacterium]